MYILNQIKKLKSEYHKKWKPCEKCVDGYINGVMCDCLLDHIRTIKLINSGIPKSLLNIDEREILSSKSFKKMESLFKDPNSFIEYGLGIFLYGDSDLSKTKILVWFLSQCLNIKNISGLFVNFTEFCEMLRRRKMSLDYSDKVDKLFSKDIIMIDGLNNNVDERLYPDILQMLEQIFLRQNSALLITSDITDIDEFKYPKSIIEFLFKTSKIKPIKIRYSTNMKHWSGRIYNRGGR